MHRLCISVNSACKYGHAYELICSLKLNFCAMCIAQVSTDFQVIVPLICWVYKVRKKLHVSVPARCIFRQLIMHLSRHILFTYNVKRHSMLIWCFLFRFIIINLFLLYIIIVLFSFFYPPLLFQLTKTFIASITLERLLRGNFSCNL